MDIKNSMILANMMSSKIPAIYKVLDWIQSTGTQYIDTRIVKNLSSTYRIKGIINWQDISTRQLNGMQGYVYFGVLDGKYQIAQSGQTTNISASLNADTSFDIFFDIPNSMTYYTIDEETASHSCVYGTNLINFYLFNLSNLSFACKCKMKPCMLWQDGILVRNFIPVRRLTDNEVGMYDTVSKTFFTNAGTGKFIGSDEIVYTVVGSPTITDGVVSGFDSSNYLQLPQITSGTVNSFEISTKITTGATLTDSTIIGINLSYNYGINLYAGSKYFKGRIKIGANYYEVDSATQIVKTSSTYFLKFIVDTETGKEYLKVSTDNINWQTTERDIATSVIDNTIQWRIGTGSVGAFDGSIDLNNTYIKLNRKLWFNGQPS